MTLPAFFSGSLLASTLLFGSTFVQSANPAEPAIEASFEQRLDAMLNDSREKRRGLVFHIRGQRIAGVVRELTADAVVVANQERGHILIRRELIDAVEGD